MRDNLLHKLWSFSFAQPPFFFPRPFWPVDVLSPEEEAELEALRLEAAHLRQEALREDTSRDGLERKVELLQREYRLALEEQNRLEQELHSLPKVYDKETVGQEQAMKSARKLLATLLASDFTQEVPRTAAVSMKALPAESA
ncbi:Pentatricopeptide repeat-containing protein [Durusdinium trenchii]|uniref:Mitochondrial n=1 Tax=Durusdinium trenchii TaxID=1381693 RepID=A0ABP0QR36_9DINO